MPSSVQTTSNVAMFPHEVMARSGTFTMTKVLKTLFLTSTAERACWHPMHVAVSATSTLAPSVFKPKSFSRVSTVKVLYATLLGSYVALNAWIASVSIVVLATSTKSIFRNVSLQSACPAAEQLEMESMLLGVMKTIERLARVN